MSAAKEFEKSLLSKAKSLQKHIVLPEGSEERTLKASDILLRDGIVKLTLIGDEKEIRAKIEALGLKNIANNVAIVDPKTSPMTAEFTKTFFELRKAKGITMEEAAKTMQDTSYFGTMMVYMKKADGMVSGAIHSTADTIRPALQIIKTKPGISLVSSVFFMCLEDRVLVYGDCAIATNPTPAELAEIAICSADTAASFGMDPKVAMLSYSTGTSGKGPDVDHVVAASKILKEKAPTLKSEGPIQYDAAIDPDVAKTKLPNSLVAGKANVFIFPELNSGNIAYKAVQRATNCLAIGPVCQGLNAPINDLSRGCLVEDIVNTIAITAVMAQK